MGVTEGGEGVLFWWPLNILIESTFGEGICREIDQQGLQICAKQSHDG